METYKVKCTHCGKTIAYKLTGFESETTCKHCKKDMNINFDFSNKKATLY